MKLISLLSPEDFRALVPMTDLTDERVLTDTIILAQQALLPEVLSPEQYYAILAHMAEDKLTCDERDILRSMVAPLAYKTASLLVTYLYNTPTALSVEKTNQKGDSSKLKEYYENALSNALSLTYAYLTSKGIPHNRLDSVETCTLHLGGMVGRRSPYNDCTRRDIKPCPTPPVPPVPPVTTDNAYMTSTDLPATDWQTLTFNTSVEITEDYNVTFPRMSTISVPSWVVVAVPTDMPQPKITYNHMSTVTALKARTTIEGKSYNLYQVGSLWRPNTDTYPIDLTRA